MSRLRSRLARRHEDSGFSLIEVLVAMGIFAALGVVMLSVVVQGQRSSGKAQSRSEDTSRSRLAVDTVSKKLRAAVDPSSLGLTVATGTTAFVAAGASDVTFYSLLGKKSVTAPTGTSDAKPDKVRLWVDDGTTAGLACLNGAGKRQAAGTLCKRTWPAVTTSGTTTWPTATTPDRIIASGITSTVAAPMFTYETVVSSTSSAGIVTASYATLPLVSGAVAATSLADVDAMSLSLVLQTSRLSGRPTTVEGHVTMSNLGGF